MPKQTSQYENSISVIMPTFRRPDGLKVALTSLLAMNPVDIPVEIIVADNDPEGSAKDYVQNIARTAKLKVMYIHVPIPGVSNARNAALDIAKGRYIAWLDDDQDASLDWLALQYATCKKYKSSMVFSPTIARIPGDSIYNAYYKEFFERKGPDFSEGVLDHFYGCGNSFMDRSQCVMPTPAFSVEANETGGEDDLLFSYIKNHGGTFSWAKAALCHEDIRPHRATPSYIKARSFANGQGPTQIANDEKDILGIIKWMIIGAIQCAIYGPLTFLTKLTGRVSYIKYLSKFYQGAGKVLWFSFKPKLYGAAVVKNKNF